MKKGDLLPITIEDVTFGSEGLGRVDGRVVFVPGALPGEEVVARVIKKKRDYVRARVVSLLKSSPARVPAPCIHFPVCGGCKWQDVDYAYQLRLKHRIVSETLRRLGNFAGVPVHTPLPAPAIYHYRNKMEFSFSAQRWILPEEEEPLPKPRDFALGLHTPGRYDKVLDIDACWLQSNTANEILGTVKNFAHGSKKTAWNTRDHTGFWRYLVIRQSHNSPHLMVNIVTAWHEPPLMKELRELLLQQFPRITSLVNNVTTSRAGSAFGEQEFLLAGSSSITEKIGDFEFEISANSFFQTNSKQAERLYRVVREYAELTPDDLVFDLYSGTGTIALFLSSAARRVIGFEVIEPAVRNAEKNAQRNRIENCHFILGDVREEFLRINHLVAKFGKPDVVIVDPPRAGIHPKGIEGILALQPDRMVFVSCNPATFSRDAALMGENGYRLVQVQPVDMFPHTSHIELVAQLKKATP